MNDTALFWWGFAIGFGGPVVIGYIGYKIWIWRNL